MEDYNITLEPDGKACHVIAKKSYQTRYRSLRSQQRQETATLRVKMHEMFLAMQAKLDGLVRERDEMPDRGIPCDDLGAMLEYHKAKFDAVRDRFAVYEQNEL